MKKADFKSEYMLLDRLRIDCEYYIQNQNLGANEKCLWALDEKKILNLQYTNCVLSILMIYA